MPFTGSHPAAILPFLRTPLPASALVIGGMAPDIPYYLPVSFPWRTHTAVAVVTTDVLLGVLAWVLWHALLSEPALHGSPSALRGRLVGIPLGLAPRLRSVARAAWVVPALVVGTATHVLWDEFTHPRRWGTEHIPALDQTWGLLPGYRWLQYAGGLVGGVVLLVWFVRWWRRVRPSPVADPREPWWVWALLAVAGGVAGGSPRRRRRASARRASPVPPRPAGRCWSSPSSWRRAGTWRGMPADSVITARQRPPRRGRDGRCAVVPLIR